jgi:receptor-binding and translocation channel-forming TcA subunit of Tc toxin
MATNVAHQEKYLSYRRQDLHNLLDEEDLGPFAPAESALQAAHAAFYQRQYSRALELYKQAAALLEGIAGAPSEGTRGRIVPLLDALLDASMEWLNAAPLSVPDPGIARRPSRPAQPTPPAVERPGLFSRQLATPAAAQAAIDWQMARRYTEQGNTRQAELFMARARADDANAVQALEQAFPRGTSIGSGPRLPTRLIGTTTARFALRLPPSTPLANQRLLRLRSGDQLISIAWDTSSEAPPTEQVRRGVYQARQVYRDVRQLSPAARSAPEAVLEQTHNLGFVIPLCEGECYLALGDYDQAEVCFYQAADYPYLNVAIEGKHLFTRLAQLYLEWGDALYKDDRPTEAAPKYEQVFTMDGKASPSRLYTLPALAAGAEDARKVIENLLTAGVAMEIACLQRGAVNAGAATRQALQQKGLRTRVDDLVASHHLTSLNDLPAIVQAMGLVNSSIAAIIKDIEARWAKLGAGLGFCGSRTTRAPVWTFDYLYTAAVNLAQQALAAERDLISYLDRFDQSALTRQQAYQNWLQAQRETQVAHEQWQAAKDQEQAYQKAIEVAQQRADDATANAALYKEKSADWVLAQALAAQVSAGATWGLEGLFSWAQDAREHMWTGGGTGIPSESSIQMPWFSAVWQLVAGRIRNEYEQAVLDGQAVELQKAAEQAQAELTAAEARTKTAKAARDAALARQKDARDYADAFDAEFFTPDVWFQMGMTVSKLYSRYLQMAIEVAREMQEAFKFENDIEELWAIKDDYSSGLGTVSIQSTLSPGQLIHTAGGDTDTAETKTTIGGLLGADQLLLDIQWFTSYRLVRQDVQKLQLMKHTVSLAQRYPYLFESQFRRSGAIEFTTSMEDFDEAYPGTYGGRIQAVEVEVYGIVPPRGLSGTLTISGLSFYRLPSAQWTDPNGSGLKYRVQPAETLVLSDYTVRGDALLLRADDRMRGIFEGAGVCSLWRLELPKAINDVHFPSVTDVRVTFYYKARYDPELATRVRQKLSQIPGIHGRQRGLPLRWYFPDAFFQFKDTGTFAFSLRVSDFPVNETQPLLDTIGLLVMTDEAKPLSGAALTLAAPGKPAIPGHTDDQGYASSTQASSSWQALVGGPAVGDYTIAMPDAVSRAKVGNLALMFNYRFTPPV